MTKASTDMSTQKGLRADTLKALAAIKASAERSSPDPFAGAVAAFLANLSADIDWIMQDKSISQAELARRLNCSEARISKLLGGGRGSGNMTAATIARIMAALGESLNISTPRLDELKQRVDEVSVIASAETHSYAFALRSIKGKSHSHRGAPDWMCARNVNDAPPSPSRVEAAVAA